MATALSRQSTRPHPHRSPRPGHRVEDPGEGAWRPEESGRDMLARSMGTTGDIGCAKRTKLKPGARLVREWGGAVHEVTVVERGFEWNGRTWASLSGIAEAITGGHWSGPRFFGPRPEGGPEATWKGPPRARRSRPMRSRRRPPTPRRSRGSEPFAVPSTPASPPRKGRSRASTRSTPSARPAKPMSRARRPRAGWSCRRCTTMAASPAGRWVAPP